MTDATKTEVRADVRAALIKNAVECTYYVANGRVMARELAEKYGISENAALNLLAVVATELVDKMKVL